MLTNFPLPRCPANRVRPNHNNGLVLSFGDGHVEHHKWLEKTTLGPIGVTGPRHTSATDQDIAWLQERAAERVP